MKPACRFKGLQAGLSAERVGFEPTDRDKPVKRFRVVLVMATSIPLRILFCMNFKQFQDLLYTPATVWVKENITAVRIILRILR